MDENSEEGYVASNKRRYFHILTCRWAKEIRSVNKVYFRLLKDAQKNRKPCKTYRPEDYDLNKALNEFLKT